MPVQSRAASNWSRRQNGIAQPGVTASGASSGVGAGADADAAPERAALAGSGGGGSDDARASAAASADGASRDGAVLAEGRGSALYVAIGGLLLAGCFCGGPAPPLAPLDWRPAKNAPAHSNAVMAGHGGARIPQVCDATGCANSTRERGCTQWTSWVTNDVAKKGL